jgi:hypothetical protein
MELIITTPEALQQAINIAVKNAMAENMPVPTYTINQVSKMLQRSNRTIKSLVDLKIIPTTPDGLITQTAINNYLHS